MFFASTIGFKLPTCNNKQARTTVNNFFPSHFTESRMGFVDENPFKT